MVDGPIIYPTIFNNYIVYSPFHLARKYFNYYRNASNSKGHGMHSPFVFDFVLNVLNNHNNYQPPPELEVLRRDLLNNKTTLHVEDLGAGSRTRSNSLRTISKVAASALKPRKYAELLYRLVKHYKPEKIVELGTSLGLTTAYLSKANPDAGIFTIEGSHAIASVSEENFRKLNCNNIELVVGNFDQVLPDLLLHSGSVDLAYIDGNHRYEPTMNYFEQLLRTSHEKSIFVLDDIHWSAEMEKAWEEIKQHPSVIYTIDIFFLGFVFFRREFKFKQNFSIRF